MKILLRQVRIIDPSSPFHQQTTDILVDSGIIAGLAAVDARADQVIDIPGLHASPGWLDSFANFCDPGFEYRETLETGCKAAAAGGYTAVMLLPNTSPVIHNKAGVEYLVQRSRDCAVDVHPLAAITKNTEGKELAEMYDMHQSGAVAFSDGTNPVQSAGLLLKALQYLKAIDKTIIQLPDDRSVSPTGLMNEGVVSTQLGLPGKAAIAEHLMIARDIELVKYTGSKIHFTGVSAAESLALIREAKQQGLAVSCSIAPYQLYFTDDDLVGYDANLKVNPPLRTKKDQDAVKQALLDGTIDCIASHHIPQDDDHKVVEFEYAHYGMTGLETCFAVLRTSMPELSLEKIVDLLSTKPRQIFDLPAEGIKEKASAAISLFLPDENWTVGELFSKSHNSPFIGRQLTGKPVGIINKENVFLNQ